MHLFKKYIDKESILKCVLNDFRLFVSNAYCIIFMTQIAINEDVLLDLINHEHIIQYKLLTFYLSAA